LRTGLLLLGELLQLGPAEVAEGVAARRHVVVRERPVELDVQALVLLRELLLVE